MGIFKRPLKFVSAKFSPYSPVYQIWVTASTRKNQYSFGVFFNKTSSNFLFNSVKQHKFGYKIAAVELDFK